MALTSASDGCTDWWSNYPKCPPTSLTFQTAIQKPITAGIICIKTLLRKPQILYGSAAFPTSKQGGNGIIFALWWTSIQEKLSSGISLPMPMLIWLLQPFGKPMKNETLPMALCSILIREPSILLSHSGSFWILCMLCSLFKERLSFWQCLLRILF